MKTNNADFQEQLDYDMGCIVGIAHATEGLSFCIPPSKLGNFNWCSGYRDGFVKAGGKIPESLAS